MLSKTSLKPAMIIGFAILSILAGAIGISGCSSPHAMEGSWKLYALDAGENSTATIDHDTINELQNSYDIDFSEQFMITLGSKKSGDAKVLLSGAVEEGTWSASSDSEALLIIGNESSPMLLDSDGHLIIDRDSAKIIFERSDKSVNDVINETSSENKNTDAENTSVRPEPGASPAQEYSRTENSSN